MTEKTRLGELKGQYEDLKNKYLSHRQEMNRIATELVKIEGRIEERKLEEKENK